MSDISQFTSKPKMKTFEKLTPLCRLPSEKHFLINLNFLPFIKAKIMKAKQFWHSSAYIGKSYDGESKMYLASASAPYGGLLRKACNFSLALYLHLGNISFPCSGYWLSLWGQWVWSQWHRGPFFYCNWRPSLQAVLMLSLLIEDMLYY